ncbi:DUF2461 domain-containing protein [Aridibaculum aurantiacum]|uniref:DUF2461 domain-containing protein n=1 Tax=Aridibaculum aurantiacum TaxID=2810307 RepID=UPI001A975A46|nr:DUF2461 domain-containing protein [Aridibaculum aurantiacum]
MLSPSTLQYLVDLKANNNKPWFDENRSRLDAARNDFEQMVSEILKQLADADPDMAPLEPKKCIFRQYRDVRFSNDKTPYKHHMGASFDRGGKSSGFAGYYFHCEPGNNSMVGGGLWMPPADVLKKVRQEIDYCYDELKAITGSKEFKKTYGDLDASPEYKLTREPKGYEKDNSAIEYLKLKSFVAIKPLTDNDLTSKGITSKIVKDFIVLMPLVKFINRAIE